MSISKLSLEKRPWNLILMLKALMYKQKTQTKKRNSKSKKQTNSKFCIPKSPHHLTTTNTIMITTLDGTLPTSLLKNRLISKPNGSETLKTYSKNSNKNLLKSKSKKALSKRVFNSLNKMKPIISAIPCGKYTLNLTGKKSTKNSSKSPVNLSKSFILVCS